jgi:hypothetical protein
MNIYDYRKLFEFNLEGLDNVIENMILKLMIDSEDLWKLLKYNDFNALANDNLTMEEKKELVEIKQPLKNSNKPFKLVPYMNGQVLGEETTEIRIYPYNTNFTNETYVTQSVSIEIITHYNNYLIKDGFRVERIKSEIIRALNNFNYDNADGILGRFTFQGTNSRNAYYTDSYIGARMLLIGDIK